MRIGLRIGAVVVLGLVALAVPLSAGAAAKPITRTFTLSYDGSGKYSYNAQGANGDAGCYMNVSQTGSYAFDQLWQVTVKFTSQGKGKYKTQVTSIKHLDGPQDVGKTGESHLEGKQTHLPDNACQQETIVDDTGTFDCTSKTVTLTAVPNPQLKVVRSGTELDFEGQAFLTGIWTYKGSDTIPSDKKKGCATYEEDMTYGSTLIPGIYDESKVGMTIKQLLSLKKGGKSIVATVSLGRNTELPRQTTCDSVFGKPNVCVVHSQSMSAKFRVGRGK
jgi:hypothetical protein